MPEFAYSELQRRIGYVFRDEQLLRRAFVHSSYAFEHAGEVSNEKLEFLGDAVLELVFSEKLFFESGDEGVMTTRRQRFVSDESLEIAVRSLGLEEFLLVGGGKENLGKKAIPSLLEAVIAAIYLDGGYEEAKAFVKRNVAEQGEFNFVGALQELCQGRGEDLPSYEILSSEGQENALVFTCRANIGKKFACGKGSSKKEAKKAAAKELYQIINQS